MKVLLNCEPSTWPATSAPGCAPLMTTLVDRPFIQHLVEWLVQSGFNKIEVLLDGPNAALARQPVTEARQRYGQIQNEHAGLQLLSEANGLVSVGGLSNDAEVRLRGQQRADAKPHEGMVVGNEDINGSLAYPAVSSRNMATTASNSSRIASTSSRQSCTGPASAACSSTAVAPARRVAPSIPALPLRSCARRFTAAPSLAATAVPRLSTASVPWSTKASTIFGHAPGTACIRSRVFAIC